jgi:hypothetical protein
MAIPAFAVLLLPHINIVHGQALSTCFNVTGETIGWVDEPNWRSTLSIITSCLVTMGLCVWSALHLNIPSGRDSQARIWMRNIKWILVGVFGPELVVFAAWRQYVSARAMQKLDFVTQGIPQIPQSLNHSPRPSDGSSSKASSQSHLTEPQPNDTTLGRPWSQWTVVHGFYATMGGFVFDLDENIARALCLPEGKRNHLTITPWGVAVLVDCGLLPVIPLSDIKDKSKADGLAKGVVCLQAAWMVVQAASRLAYGLPVSLLEVNTIGHVICAMIIYAFWCKCLHLLYLPQRLTLGKGTSPGSSESQQPSPMLTQLVSLASCGCAADSVRLIEPVGGTSWIVPVLQR